MLIVSAVVQNTVSTLQSVYSRLVSRKESRAERRASVRHPFHLPVALFEVETQAHAMDSVTEDVGEQGMSVLLAKRFEPGVDLDFLLTTPLGEISGRGSVVRTEKRVYAARPYFLTSIRIWEFADTGKKLLNSLCYPLPRWNLQTALIPEKAPLRIPVKQPALRGLLGICPFLLVTLGVFHLINRDDLFLRDVVAGRIDMDEVQTARVESLYQATMEDRYAPTDRLALLMGALPVINRSEEVDRVTLLLAPRDRHNLELQLALAHALDNGKNYESAEREYQRLFQAMKRGQLAPGRHDELLLSAARASVHAGNVGRAVERFGELLADHPDDRALRNEFAGVLLSGGGFAEASALLEGNSGDLDSEMLLIAIATQTKDYAAAERHCRNIIRMRPDDVEAKLLLANVLSWSKSGYRQAERIFTELIKVQGNNKELMVRLAQIALWGNHYDEALLRYQGLLDAGMNKPEIMRGYVDSAASAEKLTAIQKKTALAVYDWALASASNDAVFLARLAWVLQRVDETEKSTVLLDQAVALDPKDPVVRRQWFGALVNAGRINDVLNELKGKEIDVVTRRMLVGLYLKNRRFGAAVEECRLVLKAAPDDRAARRQLADVLSWDKQYKESLALLMELGKDDPKDAEIPVRLAEVTLWSGDYPKALGLYQELLEADFNRSKLWAGFIDAAAGGSKPLTDAQSRILAQIAEQTMAGNTKDVVLLTRLAWALSRCGDKAEAGIVLDKALALGPKEPAICKELAGVLAAVGRFTEGCALLASIPLQPEERFTLVEMYAGAKDFASAAKECREILKLRPQNPRALRLLANVLSWNRDYKEALPLFEDLVNRNPADVDLAVQLAQVTLWSGDYDRALSRYHALLKTNFEQPTLWPSFVDAGANAKSWGPAEAQMAIRIAERVVGDSHDVPLLTRLAWVLHRGMKAPLSNRLLDRAIAENVVEPAVSKELAGVLAAVGRYPDALKIYQGLPLTPDDHVAVANVYSAINDFAKAETECRAALKEKPKDPKILRALADVLSWKKAFAESAAIYKQLVEASPQDLELRARLADVSTWAGAYAEGAAAYQGLLEKRFDQPKLWEAFVNAASAAPEVTDAQVRLARNIYQRINVAESKDVAFLSRLAWILHRGKEIDPVAKLLERALNLRPTDPALRKELAQTLAGTGRTKAALALFASKATTWEDRLFLAELHATDKDYATAAASARNLLKEKPGDLRALQLLADVLTWSQQYPEALPLLEQLAALQPNDAKLQNRLAEVTLWSGNHEKALGRFEVLLNANFERPEVWMSFVNAAASVEKISPDHLRLAQRINKALAKAKQEVPKDAVFLARLAWVLYKGGDKEQADLLLTKAVAMDPRDPALRRELAGTLAASGRPMEALQMYKSMPLNLDDRYGVIGSYSSMVRLQQPILVENPEDPEANKIMDYLATWEKVYTESLETFEKMADAAPNDRKLQRRRAEVNLWSGHYDTALSRFTTILVLDFQQPDLWTPFVNSASSAQRPLTTVEMDLTLKIYQKTSKDSNNVPYLCRLAWVLYRSQAKEKAELLLDRALALKPAIPDERKELASVLAALGRPKEALKLYEGLKRTFADHFRLAGIYTAAKDYPAAEREIRAVLDLNPEDEEAKKYLADILCWSERYEDADKIYRALEEKHPKDPALTVRRARVMLWSKRYDSALRLYQELLDKNLEQPDLWKEYVDAAASAKGKPARKTVLYVYEKTSGARSLDVTYLARMAWVLRRVDENAKSLVLLKKAVATAPKSRALRLQLAEALSDSGAYNEAEREFQAIMKLPR